MYFANKIRLAISCELSVFTWNLASVAQLDACLTGDQEVAGSNTPQVGNILSWRFDHEIFSTVILSLLLIKRAVVSFWRKNVHNTG